MNIYTHLLLSVFDDWVDTLDGTALVDYAVVCRSEMLALGPHSTGPASTALAAEVAYDRALIKLCAANGIEAGPLGFAQPATERARLERELAGAGIDLAAFDRRGRH